MSNWISIPIISVLVVALAVGAYFLFDYIGQLNDAEDEIVSLEGEITGLENDVSGLEDNVASLDGEVAGLEDEVDGLESDIFGLEIDLADSQADVANLGFDLDIANGTIVDLEGEVTALEFTNSTLLSELNLVKSPRHFTSIQELTDWLDDDDTNIRYAGETTAEKAYILQVRALRDGYILAAFIVDEDGIVLAVIGDEYWGINPDDDDLAFISYMSPLPSKPLQ